MKTELTIKKCKPCNEKTGQLERNAMDQLRKQLDPNWQIVDGHHLEREYAFQDFKEALDFTNRVGEIAEQEGHHPDVDLGWGRVKLKFWTHSIGGLSENDFIMAAKSDAAR